MGALCLQLCAFCPPQHVAAPRHRSAVRPLPTNSSGASPELGPSIPQPIPQPGCEKHHPAGTRQQALQGVNYSQSMSRPACLLGLKLLKLVHWIKLAAQKWGTSHVPAPEPSRLHHGCPKCTADGWQHRGTTARLCAPCKHRWALRATQRQSSRASVPTATHRPQPPTARSHSAATSPPVGTAIRAAHTAAHRSDVSQHHVKQ